MRGFLNQFYLCSTSLRCRSSYLPSSHSDFKARCSSVVALLLSVVDFAWFLSYSPCLQITQQSPSNKPIPTAISADCLKPPLPHLLAAPSRASPALTPTITSFLPRPPSFTKPPAFSDLVWAPPSLSIPPRLRTRES